MYLTVMTGNLGATPELRETKGGLLVADLSVATTIRRKRDGEWRDVTQWVKVPVFGRRAEAVCNYLSKGSPVIVRGVMDAEAYLTKSKEPRAALVLRDAEVEFVRSGRGEPGPAEDSQPDDGVPF